MNTTIDIQEVPTMKLAYVSSLGDQNLSTAFDTLIKWATPKGLMQGAKLLTTYHDSFKVTEAQKVRMSACLVLNHPVKTEGEVGTTAIEAGKCIVGSFEIGLDEFEKSWTGLFIWMNEHGYQKADRPPFEMYHNNFNEHPEKKAIVDFYLPVQ